jgi:hypothetical protein
MKRGFLLTNNKKAAEQVRQRSASTKLSSSQAAACAGRSGRQQKVVQQTLHSSTEVSCNRRCFELQSNHGVQHYSDVHTVSGALLGLYCCTARLLKQHY